MPLDRTIQELESRLPDLRHLIADGEMVLATSESAALLADELGSLLTRADTVASRLRQLLLGGNLPSLSARADVPEVSAPMLEPVLAPEPLSAEPETGSEPTAWSDMDDELARIMSIEVEIPDEAEPADEGQPQAHSSSRVINRGGEIDADRELRALEEKLGITPSPELRQLYQEVKKSGRQQSAELQERIEDALRWSKDLSNPLKKSRPDDPDDLPGGAAVGAPLKPVPPPRQPGNERTVAESEEPPRNP